jgi:uncharacterized protein
MATKSLGWNTPLYLAVVQASPFCNIDCKYCYLPERSSKSRMADTTLRSMARFFFDRPERLHKDFTVLWHGGEPTAVPVAFYESAFSIFDGCKPAGAPLQNRFSTNATLLTQEWCDLIKRWNVTIRVSIDGPKALHDANRITRSKEGTFERVMRGVQLLRDNNIPFDVISTLSHHSLDHAEAMWRLYRDIGASALFFCIEEVLGVHQRNSLESAECYQKIQGFFRTLLELRDREAPGFYIRELDELIDGIPRWRGRVVRHESIPMMIVSIGWDGSVSTFSPELLGARHIRYGDFIFGNVNTHSADDILDSPKLGLVYQHIKEGIEACKASCEYFSICGGGCPAAKVFETGAFESTETLSCRLRIKAVGGVVLDHLNKVNAPVRRLA